MPVSDLEKGLKEMMESMNNLGANVCDLAKNNPDHFYQMLKGNTQMILHQIDTPGHNIRQRHA